MDTKIIELEHAAATHWQGIEQERLGDWLLRAAGGFTGRANSALPLGNPGRPLDAALAAVVAWYRTRGLPPMIAVPIPLDSPSELDDALSARFWAVHRGPVFVMTADLAQVPVATRLPGELIFREDDEPDREWLRVYRYRGQSELPPSGTKVLMSADRQAFVSIRSAITGEAAAVGRLSFGRAWAGITSVAVGAAYRRRGLGTALTLGICASARAHGAKRIFLQVEAGNGPARSLYERCGFVYSHRYQYRFPPSHAQNPGSSV